MKSLTPLIFTFIFLLIGVAYAHADSVSIKPSRSEAKSEKLDELALKKLTDRLEEIKQMPIKSLTRKERRELRHEVKAIERAIQTNSNGVYLSVGAVIIIALLLILLL
jgi:ABC-type anion transport system duplicated permease subunit